MMMEQAEGEYSKLTRQTYRLIKGTWGYCPLKPEMVRVKDESDHLALLNPLHITNGSPVISPLYDPDFQHQCRGYLCFADELDALQFRLTVFTTSRQVLMWPERRFTIHEVVKADES
jgi:hypothetical protein